MRRFVLGCLLIVLGLGITLPTAAQAEKDTVLMVVAVSVKPGKLGDYVKRVSQGNAIIQRLNVQARMRMWHAVVAGPNTGTVVVGLEYPSLAAYADGTTKMQADPEWQKLIGGLDDIRTVQSTALYREITP